MKFKRSKTGSGERFSPPTGSGTEIIIGVAVDAEHEGYSHVNQSARFNHPMQLGKDSGGVVDVFQSVEAND